MSNCVHDNGEYCEVFSDKEVRQPCFETPLCEDYKEIVRCKDCKYWLPTTEESIKDGSYINHPHPCEINCWGNRGEWRTADDFCSKGKRRGEEEC